MVPEKLFAEIKKNIKSVISRKSALGKSLWEELLKIHPADIAEFLANLSVEEFKKIYMNLPNDLGCEVFKEFSEPLQALALSSLNDGMRIDALGCLTTDELTDLFENLSDSDLKHYLNLLHKKDREKVLDLLKFNPESAGGVMDTDTLALSDDFTVHKSIQLLQRLDVDQEIHRQIFIINQNKHLVGHILLEDLVIQKPQKLLSSIVRKDVFVAQADDDQEFVANKMVHYNLSIVPVVDKNNYFLGIIPSQTLVDIIEEESAENVYRMSAMTPVKGTYFDVSFFRLLYERSYILIILLLAQSISSLIIDSYEVLLTGLLMQFLTMLTSTGGNASSQTSAIIIQGMASGEINQNNLRRFFKREIILACAIALILGGTAFVRVYITSSNIVASAAVGLSIFAIVMVSIVMGSVIPVFLRRLRIDPAYSAGPVLATLMDIVGLMIYCTISQGIFTYFKNFS
ncbi:MAG: magnesium transporter [Alteromonas naphthalenivorans]|jgi:magnesium transporter